MAAKVGLEAPIFWSLDNGRSALCQEFECPSDGNLTTVYKSHKIRRERHQLP